MHADFVLSLGAPKTGLLAASGEPELTKECKHFVADIGISNKAWRKFGTRSKDGVHFGSEWVTGMRYRAGSE